ncbi:MAG: putative amidohydrolase YtcJ, partial [Woeseiaceae bacterium]
MIYMEIIKSLRLLILLISILFLYSCEASDNSADIVLTNGKIYTVNDNQPWVESIAIKDGKFIFVGKNKDIGQFIGQNTKKHNLNNAMVLPGIIDAHTHPGSIAIRDNYDAIKKSGYPN